MAKFSYKSKLSKQEQDELLIDFCDAISSIKDSNEAARFLKDLLSPQEAEMLAKRIKIADLLLDDWKYKQIGEFLKVGEGTIARISEWLKFTGDGYRLIVRRLREKKKTKLKDNNVVKEGIDNLMKRYPNRFWPELLIQNIIKNKRMKDRERILNALEIIKEKPSLYRMIEKEIKKVHGL